MKECLNTLGSVLCFYSLKYQLNIKYHIIDNTASENFRYWDPDYIFDNPGYSLINVKQVFWSFLKCFYQEKVENLGFVKWTFAYPVKMQANKLENGVWFWDIEVYTCISMYITKTCIQKNCRKLTRKRLLSFFLMGKGLEQRLLKKMKPQQPVSMKSSASLANREMQIKTKWETTA